MNKLPIIVNLCGAPGAGKSTGAAYIFSQLKMRGVNAELITEFAKDKTWENNTTALSNQLYVLSKQYYRIDRCKGQVEVIVTDSPIILSLLYGANSPYRDELSNLILKLWRLDNNFLYFVNRVKPYNPVGRSQTKEESDLLATTLKEVLDKYNIDYGEVRGTLADYDLIVEEILLKREGKSISPWEE